MLPGRVPAVAVRLSRPEDPRSVAEALYEESLGDEQTRVGAEVSRGMLHFLRRVGANAPTIMVRVGYGDGLLQVWGVDHLRRSGALRPHA
jgi:hypothetical protein